MSALIAPNEEALSSKWNNKGKAAFFLKAFPPKHLQNPQNLRVSTGDYTFSFKLNKKMLIKNYL